MKGHIEIFQLMSNQCLQLRRYTNERMTLPLDSMSVRHCPRPLCSSRNRSDVSLSKPFVRQLHFPWHHERLFEIQHHSQTDQVKNALSVDAEMSLDKEGGEDSAFDWFKNWWPVQVVHNLPTDRPSRIQLLGKYYVVWKGHSGNWIAMDDECPHRLAPLSEGRVEKDGSLLCSYHAWRFNESGKCVKIPHAEDEKAHSVACNSPRSAVHTYPCKSRGSLLYIWPDKSANAFAESEKVLLPLDDDFADYLERLAADGTVPMYVRYMPYSFDVLMENICDPSHVPVSHHGLIPGLSRYKAEPLQAKLVEGTARGQATIAMEYKALSLPDKRAQFELRKPGVVVVIGDKEDKDVLSLRSYLSATPICAETSALFIAGTTRSQMAKTERPNPFQRLFNRIMAMVGHVMIQSPILDGDSVFLHQQDKKIRKHGVAFRAREKYYVPTPADSLVMTFRRWFETEGQSGAAYAGTGNKSKRAELTREMMLDRYEQHTKHCKVCRDFLKNMEFFIETLKLVSFGALFIGSVLLIRASNAPGFEWKTVIKHVSIWIAVAVGTLSSLLKAFLEKNIKPRFYFEDWVHADNN